MFLGQGMLLQPLMDRALSELSNGPLDLEPNANQLPLSDQVERLKTFYIKIGEKPPEMQQQNAEVGDGRDDKSSQKAPQPSQPGLDTQKSTSLTEPALLPPRKVVDALIDWYFKHIHPWIPVLHELRFREEIETSNRSNLNIILYAISMEKFSVAGLQALVIIAFDIIGSGRGPSAWSVIGSMTRTVEQLRLSVEDRDVGMQKDAREYLIRRMSFLRGSSNWIESEERRRVFWNVFLMDRFCSVATGWNNSLTGADVRRRLPCEGAIWQAGTPVKTPYFGIAERTSSAQQALTPTSERQPADEGEVESIGGFAFCVEATESLNLVTTFFLQNAVDFSDPQDMQICLMRFKELDLRLVKWRLFLPPKWRNASVLNQDGIMDPNLTLAHITHNTAVIQLHQFVAYPSAYWRACPVSLPSQASSETCIAAACEISTIAQQYLQLSPGITNPQFSFCLFIAGRVLLAHSRYNGTELHRTFNDITLSLKKIARSWAGCEDGSHLRGSVNEQRGDNSREEEEENLASKFASRLEQAWKGVELKQFGRRDPTLDIRQPVYSDEIDQSRASSVTPILQTPLTQQFGEKTAEENETMHTECSPDSITLAFPPLPVSFEGFQDHANMTQHGIDILNNVVASSNLANDPTQHHQPRFNVDLDDIFDDQYQHMLRISTFSSNL
ncbi:hypothetical protein ABW20_dc0103781 [Dactylellina cionopaga]|nr:hypothetical protein ABW20_dc0103781 [Dactylellina cionopaga]